MYEGYFDLQNDEVMLDNGASTPPFKSVLKKVLEVLQSYGSIHRGFGYRSIISTERYEESRSFLLEKMNATEEHSLFFVSNTTDGINRLALILQEEKEKTGRDIVIVSEIEHSANLLPYLGKFNIKQISVLPDFQINLNHLDHLLKQYKGRVLAVSLAGASNVSGLTLDVKGVRELIRMHDEDTLFIIDASQYAPHHPINLPDADFWIFSGHKAYAPFGVGVVAGRKDLMENMKYSFKGGGNVKYIYPDLEPIYKPVPFNQEIGTPNYVGAVAIAESFRVLYDEIGFESIEEHEKKVTDKLVSVLNNFDFIEIKHFSSPVVLIEVKKPTSEISNFFYKNKINARMGHFCVFRFIEKLKKLKPLKKGERLNLNDYNVIRLSVGLPTSLRQIKLLHERLEKWI